jgi:signal transduction histidine kinase
MIRKIIEVLARLGFWPYIFTFTVLAIVLSELLIIVQSYWLTGGFFDKNLLIVGFITPGIDGFIVFFISAFIIRYFVKLQNDLNEAQALAHIGSWRLNGVSNALVWSDEVYRIFEVETRTKITLDLFTACIHPDDRQNVLDAFYSSLKNRMPYNISHRILMKDGRIKHIEEQCSTEFDADGKAIVSIGTVHDITEKVKIQEELHQKEELIIAQSRQAAMGEMIAMIAHQWRQPLAVMTMTVNNIKINIALGETITNEELEKMSDDISYQTQYLSKTIDDFSNFFHPNQERTNTTLSKVLDDTMNIITKSLQNNNIKVNIDNKSNKEIETYPNELLQVLLNLINNAKNVLQESEQKDAKIDITIKESDTEVTICVCDNGGGIPQEILSRLGEPYVSSRVQSGTGLGIYMSKIIVEKHLGGTLTWENRDGGACFVITLIQIDSSKEDSKLLEQ